MKSTVHALLLLLPMTALAQAPAGQPQQIPEFSQVKAQMSPRMRESLEPMNSTRDCIAASKDSAQLNQCVKIMTDYQEKMMASMGRKANAQPPQPPQLEWSAELRDKMLKGLESSITNTRKTLECLDSSSSHEQMGQCLKSAGLLPPPQQAPAQR